MHLLITALAVLWAWEYLTILSPASVPIWLQPALVAGLAIYAPKVPDWLLTACAVAGAVAVLHRILTAPDAPQTITRRRVGRLPPL